MLSARSPHPLAAFAIVLATLIVVLLGTALVPVAQAATIATSTSGFTGGPVLTANERVVIGEHRGDGALRVAVIAPTTGVTAYPVAFPALAGPRDFARLNLAGVGATVTGTYDTFQSVGARGIVGQRKLTGRMFTLGPQLGSLGSCVPATSQLMHGLAAAGDGFVATVGEDCATDRTTLRIRTAQATHVIRATLGPGDRTDFTPDIFDLRATGPALAWVEMHLPVSGPGPTLTLAIARGATGEVLLRTPIEAFPPAMGSAPMARSPCRASRTAASA